MQDLESIVAEARSVFDGVAEAAQLEQVKARYLGKTGVLTELLKGLGKLPADQRPAEGARINDAKTRIEALLGARREAIQSQSLEAQLAQEALDVTLPGAMTLIGGLCVRA